MVKLPITNDPRQFFQRLLRLNNEKDGAKRMLVYTVQKGDTLWLIAKRYGISLESLIKANPQIKDPNKIYPGDKVKVPVPGESNHFVYTVQPGDTMWSIARKFGISLDRLIAANPQITNPDMIDVGQKINVPKTSGGGSGGGTFTYVVQSGDTMWSIARRFGVSLDALIAANPQISNPDMIDVGQKINVPKTGGGVFQYTVQSGDTLWLIAKRFGVSLNALIKANPQIENPDKIFPGQVINIPGKSHAPSPAPSPTPPPTPPTMPPVKGENNGRLYIVKSGDTFFNIAQRFALNMDSLILANPQIANCDRLRPGMQLYLPGNHYVKAGETLFSIANLYGVSLQELIRINPQIADPNVISVGQRVAIPRQPNGNMATYTVKSGDSLFKIGQGYNVSVEALLAANPQITNPDKIFPGQQIAIPGPHIVQKSESLWEIAGYYGISLNDLIAANPQIKDPDRIFPGQMVRIPVSRPQVCREEDDLDVEVDAIDVGMDVEVEEAERAFMQPPGVDYVVQRGDTLTSIAAMYNVSLESIITANPQIKDPNRIVPGQVIRIPVGAVDSICYMVKSGDSLYKIARMFGVSLNSIIAANPQIENVDLIFPGQMIRVPIRRRGNDDETDEAERETSQGMSSHPRIYVVEKGDTLFHIAKKFNTTVKQLQIANPAIGEGDMIFPGQQLIILPADMVCEYRCLDCPWFRQAQEG